MDVIGIPFSMKEGTAKEQALPKDGTAALGGFGNPGPESFKVRLCEGSAENLQNFTFQGGSSHLNLN